MTEPAEPAHIKRHLDTKENAREINDFLDRIYVEQRLGDDPLLDALYTDATALLAGISHGTIKTGQPRIVERLIQIVQNLPKEGRDFSSIMEAIGACSERGLAAEGHALTSVRSR